MKKTLMAIAALGACASQAQAQSSVTIYGTVDSAIVREQGGTAGAVTNISSGVSSSSRLGFRGVEDLGQGNSALFVLESGMRVDTGAYDVAGSIFNRQAFVGLKSNTLGTLTIGRQYTPLYLTLAGVADPFGAGYSGSAKNLFPTSGSLTRTSNTLAYASPKFANIIVELSYALGEQQGSSQSGNQYGASIAYSSGKLNAKLAHNHRNNDLTAAAGAAQTPPVPAANRDIGRNTLLAANYDFGFLKAFGAIGLNEGFNSSPLPNSSNPFGGVRPTASTDSRDILVGATIPFGGSNTLIASVIDKDDTTARDQDALQVAVALNHALSRRTSVYTSYGKIRNRRGAGYTVGNNTDVGSGNAAFNLGVRHTF